MTQGQIKRHLATHGRRRAKARDQAAAETAAIAELVPLAIAAGIPKRQVATLAQISRPALDKLLADHAGGS